MLHTTCYDGDQTKDDTMGRARSKRLVSSVICASNHEKCVQNFLRKSPKYKRELASSKLSFKDNI